MIKFTSLKKESLPKKSHNYLNAMLFYYFRKNYLYLLACISLTFISCGAGKIPEDTSIKLQLLDDYIIPANFTFENSHVGGLSAIDYDGKNYYAVCDEGSKPRFYEFSIKTSSSKIDTLIFKNVTYLSSNIIDKLESKFDLESIIVDAYKKEFIISSEGAIDNFKNPFIVRVDTAGQYLNHYQLPTYFLAEGNQKPRNNGVFEGLSTSAVNSKHIWVANELPLVKDGKNPKLYRTKSPVRFTLFNENLKATNQFSYLLEPIQKIPYYPFSLNGVTDFIEIAPLQFIVIERAYSAGRGKKSNSVLLYKVDASKATNTLAINELKGKIQKEVIPAEKELIFNFKEIRKQLKQKIVDNIEGICFGPTLPNGNKTLMLIADNNFNAYTKQINQVIWLEIVTK